MSGILGLVDRLKHAIDFIGLEHHAWRLVQRILNAFTTGKPFTQCIGQTDFVDDAGIELAGPVFSGCGMGQSQQVNVGAVITIVTHLAPSQKSQQCERTAR